MHVYVFTCGSSCAVCRKQRSTSGVFLRCFSISVFDWWSHTEPGTHQFTEVGWPTGPGIQWPLPAQCCNYKCVLLCLVFYVGTRNEPHSSCLCSKHFTWLGLLLSSLSGHFLCPDWEHNETFAGPSWASGFLIRGFVTEEMGSPGCI